MTPITEANARALAGSSPATITCFEIKEAPDYGMGWFYLLIHTKETDQTGKPYILNSMRKTARRWSNINNVLNVIRAFNVPTAKITITITPQQESS